MNDPQHHSKEEHEATEPDAFCDSCGGPMWESRGDNCGVIIAYGIETVACCECRCEKRVCQSCGCCHCDRMHDCAADHDCADADCECFPIRVALRQLRGEHSYRGQRIAELEAENERLKKLMYEIIKEAELEEYEGYEPPSYVLGTDPIDNARAFLGPWKPITREGRR